MKKLSVGLPFRGQGKVQTKSWLLLLALGLLACMTMCLILVWSNIERIDTCLLYTSPSPRDTR